MKAYIIQYAVYGTTKVLLKTGKMKVKKCYSELQAKIKLEKYLSKRIKGFGTLVVQSCSEDNHLSFFNDIFN